MRNPSRSVLTRGNDAWNRSGIAGQSNQSAPPPSPPRKAERQHWLDGVVKHARLSFRRHDQFRRLRLPPQMPKAHRIGGRVVRLAHQRCDGDAHLNAVRIALGREDARVADITRADVRGWFDSVSSTPGNANRTLPVLSVMMRQAELWELRPQGSNPCRNMRRYKTKPRERFLSADELKRLGFVLDHAEDRQAAAAIRLLLFTGARSSEITGLRWDWIRGTRAVLPDSKTGLRTIWLGPEAARLVAALPRSGGTERVFPEDLTSQRLYIFWCGVRQEAGLPGLRIHDCRHTWASQGCHERDRADHGRAAARTPQPRNHGDLRPSRRYRSAGRRCAGGRRHRPRDGL